MGAFVAGSLGSALTISPPTGLPLKVNVTGGSVFTAASGGSQVTFPQTITAATTYYSQTDQPNLTVSAKVAGVETANGNAGTVTWNAYGGAYLSISPSPTTAQILGASDFSWQYGYLEPSAALAATVDGRLSASSTTAAMTSGTVYACAIPLPNGLTVSNISFFVTTAEATGTHAWCGIADNGGTVRAISADQTGAAYFGPVNSFVTTAMATPYTTTYDGLYYLFVCTSATTMPVFAAAPALSNAAVSSQAPVICGSALSGQTTPVAVSSSLGTITGTAGHQFYAYVS